MKDLSRPGFDISKISSPLHFFSLVAYIISLAILYAGMYSLSNGYGEIAWFLIVGAVVLILGVTAAIFVIMRAHHWTLFRPSELTPEYMSFVQAFSSKGKISPELLDQIDREFFFAAADFAQGHARKISNEIFDQLLEANPTFLTSYPNIAGQWEGIINGSNQHVEITQRGPMVFLKGTVYKADKTTLYTWDAEGRIIADVLVFFWQTGKTRGIDVMRVSPNADILYGKYFNQFGGTGDERYERFDNEQRLNDTTPEKLMSSVKTNIESSK